MKFPFFESVFRPSPKVARSKNPQGSSLPLRFFSVTTLGDDLNTNPKIREFHNVTGIVPGETLLDLPGGHIEVCRRFSRV